MSNEAPWTYVVQSKSLNRKTRVGVGYKGHKVSVTEMIKKVKRMSKIGERGYPKTWTTGQTDFMREVSRGN